MTGKTHMAIGIAAGLTISAGKPIESQLAIVLASAIGSLVPDLDHPRAKLNQKLLFIKKGFYKTFFYLVLAGGFVYLSYLTNKDLFALLGALSLAIGISSHRGFTHSIIGFLSFSLVAKLITSKYNLPSLYLGFISGYALHLLADFFTIKGIQLFYPVKKTTKSPIVIRSNTVLENIIFSLLSLYSFILLYYNIIR